MNDLLAEVRDCAVCAESLAHEPRPVLAAHRESRLVIIGQAPGSVVHRTGVPWDDQSGDNLRSWLGVDKTTFYDPKKIALVPMGFCYPGKGKSGDLAPRKECAPLWHSSLLERMKKVRLTLLIGRYAQDHYLENPQKNLTETVKRFRDYLPEHFVLPHPSPRNNIWQAKNSWFGENVLPVLKEMTAEILDG